jgi:ethanolamine ammonia-lyase small subunit
VQDHAPALLAAIRPLLQDWRIAPLVAVRQGRVAAGDAVAMAVGAESVVVLIGERPGLSAPDSLGAYLTWRPRADTTDAARNCVSNIRPAGLPPALAAAKITWLLGAMRARGVSGIALKDDAPDIQRVGDGSNREMLDTTPPFLFTDK